MIERNPDRTIKSMILSDFLTNEQIQQAWDIYEAEDSGNTGKFAARVERELLQPNKLEIRKRLLVLEEIDCRYLAYAIEHVFNEAVRVAERARRL